LPISSASWTSFAKQDALAGKHGEYDIVLANPPFGKKSSVTIVNEAGEQSKESLIINRDDCPLKRSRRVAKSKSRLRASRAAN
jgi:type I restriction-modification system DNA methylase subunit